MSVNTDQLNAQVANKTPEKIIEWALNSAKNPILTTNFRPYEVVILHMAVKLRPDLQILWIDSGYNTSATYRYAQKVIAELSLNMLTYVPLQTSAFRNAQMKGVPEVDDALHGEFTEQVKLEPFRRALAQIKPDYWLNAIRKEQTEFRNTLEVISASKDGVVKVAPLYHSSEDQLDEYMSKHQLENEFAYFDPTKALDNRECGLHTKI
ncbi:MAG: phosphoadenosine phosphosulfate reductase family protein [Oceanospirillaceae bacterium]|nr:phosphoadenosine phosphosulfate reductase family protein [Oceanospirillaceae bacterium]